MIAPRTAAFALVLLLAVVAELRAQGTPAVALGDRVRVSAPNIFYGSVVGSVVALSADTLVVDIRSSDTRLAVPLASVVTVEVSRGQAHRAREGAWLGGGIGALAGGIIGALSHQACERDSNCFFDDSFTEIIGGAVLVGGVGAALGFLVGSQIKVDRWETVPLDRIRVSLTPRGGGLEVTGKFVF